MPFVAFRVVLGLVSTDFVCAVVGSRRTTFCFHLHSAVRTGIPQYAGPKPGESMVGSEWQSAIRYLPIQF